MTAMVVIKKKMSAWINVCMGPIISQVQALKKEYVVAYQGDGINDAPALKLADVAIAVNTAMDIAKENADIVLLNRSLEVIINGVKYGRSIFVNINKYIRYTMLNNFGMFVALSALFLFSTTLPILPVQVLLTNLFGDAPLTTVSTDTVDDEEIVRPEQHDLRELMRLSLILGIPTALFEILYFVLIHAQSEHIVQTSLYLFFTFQALIIFYAIRNTDHFWKTKAPPLTLNLAFLVYPCWAMADGDMSYLDGALYLTLVFFILVFLGFFTVACFPENLMTNGGKGSSMLYDAFCACVCCDTLCCCVGRWAWAWASACRR